MHGREAGVAAIACVAVATWYFRMIVPPDTTARLFRTSDFFMQIYPTWLRAAEWLHAGTFPLWNPYQVCGHPFLATGIYGLLYPPNLFHLVLPTAAAIEAVIVVNLVATGMGTYAYARTVIDRADAAFVTAVTFTLSGFVLFEASWFPPASASAAWLPFALLAVERIVRRGSVAWVVVLAAALALSCLGGWMQTWVYTMWVVGAYACVRLLVYARTATPGRVLDVAARIALGVALALLLAAPQLLPTLELNALGPRRVGGLTLEQQLAPAVIGPTQLLATAVDARPGWPRAAYLGMTTLLLMPLAWFSTSARWRVIAFSVLAVLAVCVALTIHTPLFAFYRMIGGAWFRAPGRMLFVYAFAGAMLAGIGFAAATTVEGPRRRWVAGVVLLAVAMLSVVAMPRESRVVLLAGTVLLIGAITTSGGLRSALTAGLTLLLVADLALAVRNPYFRPIHGVEGYDRNAAAFTFIAANQGLYRTYVPTPFDVAEVMAKHGTLRGIYAINDYEPLSTSRHERLFRAIEPPENRRPDHLTFTGMLRASPAAPEFGLLDLMSLRYLVIGKMAVADRAALRVRGWPVVLDPPDGDVVVYENPAPLPRAYVAAGAEVASTEDAALDALTRAGFDPRSTVVLEPADDGSYTPADAAPAPLTVATITSYEPTRVVVRTDAPRSGHLVLTDSFYPDWTATVDGTPAPIVRANFLFRAVPVDAGAHELVFTYRPRSFALGIALALTGMMLAGALVVVHRRRRA